MYVVWGSTYLAIRFAVETLPPLLMAGARFIVSGTFLYAWMRMRGSSKPTVAHWRSATIVGGLLLLVGNGAVAWAEQWVPSGIAALIIASSPLWFVMIDWLQRGAQPTLDVIIGLTLGTVGIVVLIDPVKLVGGDQVHLPGAAVIVVGTFAWVAGSMYSRKAPLPSSPFLATAMEMLAGGVLLTLAGLLFGEGARFDIAEVSARSVISVAYLIVFGSLIAFTSYIWLLKVSPPAQVSTYAYVNPVIAVFLGWLLGDESLGARTLFAATIIVVAVALITTFNARRASQSFKNLGLTKIKTDDGSKGRLPKPQEARTSD